MPRITSVVWIGEKPPHLRPWWQRPRAKRVLLALGAFGLGALLLLR